MKITINDGPETLTFKLEGRISGPWAEALRESWNSKKGSSNKLLVVDLCGVTHIDTAGKEILASMHRQSGARFLADTPITKYFADEACREGGRQKDGKKGG